MDSVFAPVDNLIATKLNELVAARTVVEKLEIELNQLHQVRAVLPQETKQKKMAKPVQRNRALSDRWKMVLAIIGAAGPNGMKTDAIIQYCATAGIDIKKDTLRSQMSIYGERGLVRGDGRGVYIVTKEGLKAADTDFSSINTLPPIQDPFGDGAIQNGDANTLTA